MLYRGRGRHLELLRAIVSISSSPILWAGQVGAWQLLHQEPEVEKDEILEVAKPMIELGAGGRGGRPKI